ncbi:uncharacterized protein K02A2.6-like [Diaphorina citri]|uniref:RNA-directed DNA polymerase n=2 Tax=Diaphorina citri TaxID=121845 RepID=A0A3Q0JFZ1_DIACI|nr:uncharacterized protein K02A2.6-like [Diaphorina citri]XP_026687289.1 uncharacterized protein K02A2.6-like [Diaphorina citri]XP_026687833.1 uncharacterized protein K02A2.6-like [Diaphorina citri]XP_026687834.1 uncharacterized protein K02A2.6-like [Diaphorina citri]
MPPKEETGQAGTGVQHALPASMALKLKGQSGAQQYEAWKVFKFQFENYLVATRQSELSEERKVAILLHVMGVEIVPIYLSFNLSGEKTVSQVIQEFEKYFSPQKNLSLERNVFLSRRQMPGESLEGFITNLKNLSTTCELGSLRESLVRDIFILGLLEENSYIKERLLEEGDKKSLSEIFDLARTLEMSKEKCSKPVLSVSTSSHSRSNSYNKNVKKSKCNRCGYMVQIPHQKCPALRAMCNSCSKVGHYAKMCRVKKVNTVQEISVHSEGQEPECGSKASPNDSFFIGVVNHNNDSPWKVLVKVNNKLLPMSIDTGAEANVMSLSSYKESGLPSFSIQPTCSKLTAYGGTDIPIVGQCIINCEINKVKLPIRFFICKADQPTVLGAKACENFCLIKRIGSIFDSQFGAYAKLMSSYNDLFEGLGCLPGYVRIDLKETAVPQVNPPRRVPFKLMETFKTELDRMCEMGVIEKLTKPTEWLNSVVLVEKPDGSLRVCLDPRPLNKAIMRSQYPLPTLESIRSKLIGAQYFSKLDASTAFWSMQLDEKSTDLCAFGTPFGRFKFLRLAYGLNLAPEKFHQKMTEYLGDIDGVVCYIDDILIFSHSKEQHDKILIKVLDRMRSINLKLNMKKCIIGKQKITFLGQNFECTGMSPDLSKIEAIEKMPEPKNVKDLQRFLGMINYLSCYMPNMSNNCVNLRKLLKKESLWCWESAHQMEFNGLKKLICQAPILAFFDVHKPIVLTVDSSQFAVGACLLQEMKPVAFASRSLTETQKRWAQIEKELFAIWFGCVKFHQYIYGQSILVETDHKPLVTLFKKALSDIPNRLQRIMLKLQLYDLHVVYKAGKEMYVSDTLSRAALTDTCQEFDDMLDQELAVHSNMFMRTLNVSDAKLNEICEATKNDNILQQVKQFILTDWPSYKNLVPKIIQPFYPYRNELHIVSDIIFKGSCIVIPKSMQNELIKSMHSSHMGYNKNKNFVKDVVFWPTLFSDLKLFIINCETCNKFKPNNVKEPLIAHEVPTHPWEKVGVDLFEFDRCHYLILVDYYSKFFETALLHSTNSRSIISQFKSIFCRQGVPAQLISDRGPPFSSNELNQFYKEWNINHQCSSPYYPKSNGQVEQTVKLVKNTLIKCKDSNSDPYLALLHLRNSYSDGQEPPSKLLNARLLRTNIPTLPNQLKSKIVSYKSYRNNYKKRITNMKKSYDKGAKPLEPLKLNECVLFQKKPGDIWLPAKISKLPKQINSKRSYEVLTPDGSTYCRNRVYLRKAGKQLDEIATSNEDCGADAYLDPENEYYCHCPAFYDKEQPVESQSSPSTAGLGQDADRQSVECPSTDPGQNINVSQDSDEMLDQTDLILDNRNLLDRTVMLESDDSFVSTDMSYQDDTKNDPDWLP